MAGVLREKGQLFCVGRKNQCFTTGVGSHGRGFLRIISQENRENIEKPGCDGAGLTISFASAVETH
jgi:hypothetical protein